ncbi:hypothetical protein P154DRAFT_526654 [Amniculicola lignicola CBS 123094]|uniref:Zn(2)-C6 fungal-type domain-containing protein n=1 Tax=Amniculicola lignicola CBS 123094 TaxID=1392246 RepID=A0A6A5VZZ5_9PLEO|nr:hypothetical protein P154DRAFT_526654 [Amniculicola lignicola CBS 123094]
MPPHKRTRTGCWTCREAGYKCDEQRPYCGRCTRLKIACKGYDVKLKWVSTTAASPPRKRPRGAETRRSLERTSTFSPISTRSTSSAPAGPDADTRSRRDEWVDPGILAPIAMPVLAPDLTATDRHLLYHWMNHLSSLISITPRKAQPSSFQAHLASMTINPGALQSTVLSMAANHLALASNNPSMRIHAYRHQQNAIELLQRLILDPIEASSEPALATVLMMQISARYFGEEDVEPHMANHLAGAKAMLSQRRGPGAWKTSSSARFLVSLFAYHDILSSVSRRSCPLNESTHDFTAVEDSESMQSIAEVLHIVGSISKMRKAKMSQTPSHSGPATHVSVGMDMWGNQMKTALQEMDFRSFPRSGKGVEGDHADINVTAEAFRQAAFIYLYRVWLGFGAPNPITLEHVSRCLSCIEQTPIDSPLVMSHIWPLFTAGCEALSDAHRQFVRDRFQAMYETRNFPGIKRVMRDIEAVWFTKDLEELVGEDGGMEKIDCIQVIWRQRGREVDLA